MSAAAEKKPKPQGVGVRLPRKEDDRYMRGRGEFVGDIKQAGMKDVAFVRSPIAHGYLRSVVIPEYLKKSVFVREDMLGVKDIRAVTKIKSFKMSEQPPLAFGKVRHVGELVAMCLADTRAEAEDIAQQVQLDIDILPAIVTMDDALANQSTPVHEDWGDNINLVSRTECDLSKAKVEAAHVIHRKMKTNRQCQVPLEGRGLIATWSARKDQLVVHSATQMPHLVRNGLSEFLGLEHAQVRVIAPDVGGGFGYKGIMCPEELCVSWLAMHVGHPVRWLEDRREHLIASANCREHQFEMTAYVDNQGKILGLEAITAVNVGAYSSYPVTSGLEGAQVVSNLPGPYVVPSYQCITHSVSSNKPPILPYRGVARTSVCFAMELMIDAIARKVGREPHAVRMDNLVPESEMPYTSVTGKVFDSGNYPESLRRAVDAIDVVEVRKRQKQVEDDGRKIGVGFATFVEQGAHGTSVFAGWGIPMVPGPETATARLTQDGGLELRIGAQSHGQGMETSFAQIVNEVLGIDVSKVKLVHGDTEYTPYSTGTWGSRGAVMSGGAVATASKAVGRQAIAIAAQLMQSSVKECHIVNASVVGPSGSMTLKEVAQYWYRSPELLAVETDPTGLETTIGYKPKVDTGTFSYSTHAVIVAVDTDVGSVELLDYVIVEDGGTLINPMIVDGQIYGGLAQGIGTALFEEVPYDAGGQPLASTLADYILPGPTEVPEPRLIHMETLSPNTEFGVKGIGESGAIGPPAAIANAINDALKQFGAEVSEVPVTPARLLASLGDLDTELAQ